MAYIRRGLIINVVANEMSITCYLCTRLDSTSNQICVCFGLDSILFYFVSFHSILVRVEILRVQTHTHTALLSLASGFIYVISLQHSIYIIHILSSLNLCVRTVRILFAFKCVALNIAHIVSKGLLCCFFLVHSFVRCVSFIY